jgi:AcrR family transcriptional regulator
MESMRDRLLTAADAVMREKGLAGTTVREIAKAAGVAEGSVYNHFKNKTELITTVFLERMPRIRMKEAVAALISAIGGGDPRAHLRAFALAAISAYGELDRLASLLRDDPDTAALLRAELAARRMGPGQGVRTVAAYLRLEEEQGRVRLAADPTIVTAALMGACHEYVFQSLFHEESPFALAPEAFTAQLVDTLVHTP